MLLCCALVTASWSTLLALFPLPPSLSTTTLQAQVQVKEARERYEKLKVDTSEKIEMAVVSRCNMLSKSLPTYQNGLLAFFNEASQELQKVLIEIKANHHPQYRRTSEIVEEQDLLRARETTAEAQKPREQDGGNDDDVGLLLDIDAFPVPQDDQTKHVEEGEQQNATSTDKAVAPDKDDDDPLLSLLSWNNSAPIIPPAEGNQVDATGHGESASPNSEEQSLETLRGLLMMESLSLQEQPAPSDQPPLDNEDQWDQLSSFLGSNKSQEATDGASSDWQKELESLLGDNPLPPPLDVDPMEDFLGGGGAPGSGQQPMQPQLSGATNGGDLLMAEDLGLPTLPPQGSQSVALETLPPLDLLGGLPPTSAPPNQPGWQLTPMLPSMSTASALPTTLPPVAPTLSAPAPVVPTQGHAPSTSRAKPKAASRDKSENIYEAWSNIFSKLDPLTNDKV